LSRQFLHTFMICFKSVLCGYNNLIPVLLHTGHTPRPLEGRFHKVFPRFLFAIPIHPIPVLPTIYNEKRG
jgi:hypothetical protein